MTTQMSSRDFNQDTGRAKRSAEHGPVYITDRGRPAHVLLTYETYERMLGSPHLLDRLAEPAGVEEIEFAPPIPDDVPQPATFD